MRYRLCICAFLYVFFFCAETKSENSVVPKPIVIDVKGTFYSSPRRTSDNHIVIASHNKQVYFFDRTGNLLNSYKTNGWVHATPSELSNGAIAIGSYDRHFYFFDKDGNFQNRIKPGGFVFTNPVEIGDYIAFGNEKGQVVFYNRENDDLSYLKIRNIVHGSPMVTSDSILIVGSNNKKVHFINADKELMHTFKTRGWIMHSKAFEKKDGSIVIGSYDKHLYSLDKAGNENWRFRTGGKIHSSPIQTPDSTIVFGSFDGYIYVLSQHGELINKVKTGKQVVSSPTMLNNSVVIIGSHDGYLYFIDTQGNLLGKYNAQGRIFSSPIAFPCGTVFCVTRNGRMSFLPPEYIALSLQKNKFDTADIDILMCNLEEDEEDIKK